MKKIALLLITACACMQNFAQPVADDILHERWKAYWVDVPGTPAHGYGIYHFRKTFQLADKPAHFVVHVSADNRYKLYVNGVQVSFGPARGDVYNWNFETVDIAPQLQQGSNTIAAIVWNFGDERQEAQITYQTAFILQGDTKEENIVNTNKTWKCVEDKAYSPLQPELIYTYYAAGPTEKIDYNLYPSGWEQTGFDDTKWQQAQQMWQGLPKGVFNYTLGWMLVPRPIPPMELTLQRLHAVRVSHGINVGNNFLQGKSFTVPANTKVTLLLDQSFLTTAFPVLKFSKGKNASISLSYAEALYIDEGSKNWRNEHQKGNRNEVEGKRFVGTKDEIICSGSDNETFTSLAFRTYRYINMQIETKDEPVTINDFYGMYTGYPFMYNAGFNSDSAVLNKILEVGWRTARLDAQETYMDCPYYEQLQYVGDTRIQALVSLYNSGDDRLPRNAISQIYNSLMPEGITLSRYPTANPQEIPTFSLIWIGMLHDYWMYHGDTAFIQKNLRASRMVLSFFHDRQTAGGSLHNVPYWIFSDWCNGKGWHDGIAPIGKDGSSAMLDLQLLMAYEMAEDMEKQVGLQELAAMYEAEISKLKQSIVANYWDENKGLFADTKDKDCYSQHTSALAILTGIKTGSEAKALAQKIMNDTTLSKASVYFRYYLYRAYNEAGLGDKYTQLLGIWKKNLEMGMTTWAEIDDINRTRSDCHAWGSSPNIELYRIVLGIDSDAPGFDKVKIEPHLGDLKNASGYIPHPKGRIATSYAFNNTTGKWSVTINLPAGVTGTFIWKGKHYPLAAGETKMTLE
ncbi:MAG TPA: alpha-L-rhamnosidase N-terminal domain-containing protein [Chitinophagaceae bacterium]|nr:alpha-L-rhamnosidase N-terminal domain-containing protein [Chitinophagaceae bacterium]